MKLSPQKLTVTVAGMMCLATVANASQDLTYTYSKAGLGTMPYHVFLPDGFNSASAGSTPVILFLHGAGERGNDNTSQIKYIDGLLDEALHSTDHKAIVIVPQASSTAQWVNVNWSSGSYHNSGQPAISNSLQMAMNILSKVQNTYAQDDTNRVYVTGLSMGGYGSWDAIERFHDVFAAAMPMSGGGNLDLASTLADRGIWAWHGVDDATVPVSASDQMVAAIQAAGGDPNYDRIEGLGHWGWDGFYWNDPNAAPGTGMYDWLFSQTLAPEPGTGMLILGASALIMRRRRTI